MRPRITRPVGSLARRVVSSAATMGVVAATLGALHSVPAAAATPNPAAHKAVRHLPLSAGQARDRALSTGKRVLADAETTTNSTLTANPDGTFTLGESLAPTRKWTGKSWVDLDPAFRRNSDGTITTTATTSGLTISGGGTGPLATLVSRGRSLALTLPVTLPAPTLDGATATYPEILPGVDLIVTADAQGSFTDVLKVKTPTAAANPQLAQLTFTTSTKNLTVTTEPSGRITAADSRGNPVYTADAPTMWDSSTAPRGVAKASGVRDAYGQQLDARTGLPLTSSLHAPGLHAHTAKIKVTGGDHRLTLTPDQALLRNTHSTTVYPVYIDPTLTYRGDDSAPGTLNAWAYVRSDVSTAYYKKSDSLYVGYQGWESPYHYSRSFFQFAVPSKIVGATTLSAELDVTNTYSASCTAAEFDLYRVQPFSSSISLSNQPGHISLVATRNESHGWSSTSCPAKAVGYDVSSLVKANASAGTLAFELQATSSGESDPSTWKYFADNPVLQITYNQAPGAPGGLSTSPATTCTANQVVGDGDVVLYAKSTDPDGGNVGLQYLVTNHATGATIATTDPSTFFGPSGTALAFKLTEAQLKTAAAGTLMRVDWKVRAYDGKAYSTNWSSLCTFSFDASRPGGPNPVVPAATTVGTAVNIPVSPATCTSTCTTPADYVWQLNGGPLHQVAADSSGNATITLTPNRLSDVLTVNSLSTGGNYGSTPAVVPFSAAAPATPAADGDLTGDGLPDLLTVGGSNGVPAGLWLSSGTTGSHVATVGTDIGTHGTGLAGNGKPSDFAGTQAFTGQFTGSGLQDVLDYSPTSGVGAIIAGNGDGSALDSATEQTVTKDFLLDNNGDSPLQLANAGHTFDATGHPDLIGISGDASSGYTLGMYHAGPDAAVGVYTYYPLTTASPDGSGWDQWAVSTTQTGSGTAMFLWNRTSGGLYLWTGLSDTQDSSGNEVFTYTSYTLATGSFHPGTGQLLRAADINGDGTPDLWSVDPSGTVTANLVTNLSTTPAINGVTADSLVAPSHAWPLTDDATDGDATDSTGTPAADAAGNLPLTGASGAFWNNQDQLHSPDVTLNDTDSQPVTSKLSSTAPAITTNADFTVNVWVSPDRLGGTVLAQNGTTARALRLYSDAPSGTWRVEMTQSDAAAPAADVATAAAVPALPGQWTMLTVSYTASNGRLVLYVNGTQQAAARHTVTWTPGATGAFTVGAHLASGTYTGYLAGQVSDVQTWSKVLTPGQIAFLDHAQIVQPTRYHDYNGDGIDDLSAFYDYGTQGSTCTNIFHVKLLKMLANGNYGGGMANPASAHDDTCWGSGTQYVTTGDFNGDGRTDVAALYDYGTAGDTCTNVTHVAVFVWFADSNGDGGLGNPKRIWDGTCWGGGTKALIAGDFNGDGISDLLVDYVYSPTHSSLSTLTAASDHSGNFTTSSPQLKWDSTSIGGGTEFVTAGDWNGDGVSDVAIFYDAGNGEHKLFTSLGHSNHDGGFNNVVTAYDNASWGSQVKFVDAGDFNGDGNTDLAFFNDTGTGHITLYTMTASANSSGTFGALQSRWDDATWGTNTRFMAAGDYNGDGKSDIALWYDYGSSGSTCTGINHEAVFTLTADSNADGGLGPQTRIWDDTCFGGGTKFLN